MARKDPAEASGVDNLSAHQSENRRRRRAWFRLGVAAALLLVVIGIVAFATRDGGDQVVVGGGTDDEGTDAVGGLEGASWVLAEGVGPEGPVVGVEGYPITLNFDGATLGGTAACNGYGGSFERVDDQVSIGDLSWTEMGCEPAVMQAESAYLAALVSVDQFALDGEQLRLDGPSTELVFERAAAVPVAELVDQLWLLDTLIDGDSASTVMGDPAALLLRADGTLEAGTGCRSLSGEYLIRGSSVTIINLAAEGECPIGLVRQDGSVIAVIEGAFIAEIDSDRLTLTSQGNEGLGYRAITEEELAEAEAPR